MNVPGISEGVKPLSHRQSGAARAVRECVQQSGNGVRQLITFPKDQWKRFAAEARYSDGPRGSRLSTVG